MIYSDLTIWLIIIGLGIGTFSLRFCFLGLIGNREMPEWLLRHLRYTPVAVMPGLVAPYVVWPEVSNGDPEPARITAALITIVLGVMTKNAVLSIIGGILTLYGMIWLIY